MRVPAITCRMNLVIHCNDMIDLYMELGTRTTRLLDHRIAGADHG